jgi:predicted membrane protein
MMKKVLAGVVVGLVPLLALAQGTIISVIGKVKGILDAVVPVIIGLAVIYFLWNVAKYVLSADGKEEARTGMIWGIIGIVVMVSVWGLVALVQNSFDIRGTSAQNVPTLPN